MNLNKCNWEFLHIHAIKEVFQQIFFFHKCLLNSVGVGLGFIEPRAMIIAKALFHCIVCTRPSRQKSAFSSVGPLYWDVGPWPSRARLGRPNMAQYGPTEPSLGQQLLQIANLSSFFFWQNRNVHDEGRAKWEHWTLLWHSYQQRGSPMHSKVPSLMQIKYIAAANFFFVAPAANALLSLYI